MTEKWISFRFVRLEDSLKAQLEVVKEANCRDKAFTVIIKTISSYNSLDYNYRFFPTSIKFTETSLSKRFIISRVGVSIHGETNVLNLIDDTIEIQGYINYNSNLIPFTEKLDITISKGFVPIVEPQETQTVVLTSVDSNGSLSINPSLTVTIRNIGDKTANFTSTLLDLQIFTEPSCNVENQINDLNFKIQNINPETDLNPQTSITITVSLSIKTDFVEKFISALKNLRLKNFYLKIFTVNNPSFYSLFHLKVHNEFPRADVLSRSTPSSIRFQHEYEKRGIIGREKEISSIIQHLNLNNSILITGISGIGKTSLVRALFHKMSKNHFCTFVDLHSEIGNYLNIIIESLLMLLEFNETKFAIPRLAYEALREIRNSSNINDYYRNALLRINAILKESDSTFIIFVDNVHLLSDEQLKLFFACIGDFLLQNILWVCTWNLTIAPMSEFHRQLIYKNIKVLKLKELELSAFCKLSSSLLPVDYRTSVELSKLLGQNPYRLILLWQIWQKKREQYKSSQTLSIEDIKSWFVEQSDDLNIYELENYVISTFDEEELQVIQVASAFKSIVPIDKLACSLGIKQEKLLELIKRLAGRGILYVNIKEKEKMEIKFWHELFQIYARKTVPKDVWITNNELIAYCYLVDFNETTNYNERIEAALNACYHYYLSNDFYSAQEILKKVFPHIVKIGYWDEFQAIISNVIEAIDRKTRHKANLLYYTSVILMLKGKYKQGLKVVSKLIEDYKNDLDVQTLMKYKSLQAELKYYSTRNYDEVEDFIEKELLNNRNILSQAILNTCLYLKAQILRRKGKYQESLQILEQIQLTGEEHILTTEQIELTRAEILKREGKYELAKKIYLNVIDKGKEKRILRIEAVGWRGLALCVRLMGNFFEAEKYYFKALDIQENLGYLQEIPETLRGIAYCLMYREKIEESKIYYEISKGLCDHFSDLRGKAVSLRGLGRYYLLTKDYEKALECFKESLILTRELKHKRGEIVSLRNLIKANIALKNYTQAHEDLKKLKELVESIVNPREEVECLNVFGLYYTAIKDYKKAYLYFLETLEKWKKLKVKPKELCTIQLIVDVLEQFPEKKKELEDYKKTLKKHKNKIPKICKLID